MSHRPWRFSTRTTRWWVLCCLLVALPVCGVSTFLSALLGPVHFHTVQVRSVADSDSMAGWQDFRRTNHVRDSVFHVHDHSKLGRHHHDASDPGLVTVGATGADDAGIGSAGPAAAVLVLACSEACAVRLGANIGSSPDWLAPEPTRFRSCDNRRIDRPPIA